MIWYIRPISNFNQFYLLHFRTLYFQVKVLFFKAVNLLLIRWTHFCLSEWKWSLGFKEIGIGNEVTKIISFYYFWRSQCFASFSLDFTSKCSSEFGGDWWKLKSDLRSCLVSWGSDATLVTLGLETGIHKIRVDISKVEKRNKLKDPTVSGRWWCNIWVWPKPIHSPEYQINEGGAGKLEPPSFFFFFKLILT